MFSIGNIIGTEIFQPKDAPAYIPGKIAIMVLLTVQLFVSFLLRIAHDKAGALHGKSSTTEGSVDSLLLDQVEKLAVQILKKDEAKGPVVGSVPPTGIAPSFLFGFGRSNAVNTYSTFT